jgi:hypothetical protein
MPVTWPSSNSHYPNYLTYFQTFTKDFIDGNPQIFLSFEWINIAKLKIFIGLGVSVEMGAVTKVESEDSCTFLVVVKLNALNRRVVKREGHHCQN